MAAILIKTNPTSNFNSFCTDLKHEQINHIENGSYGLSQNARRWVKIELPKITDNTKTWDLNDDGMATEILSKVRLNPVVPWIKKIVDLVRSIFCSSHLGAWGIGKQLKALSISSQPSPPPIIPGSETAAASDTAVGEKDDVEPLPPLKPEDEKLRLENKMLELNAAESLLKAEKQKLESMQLSLEIASSNSQARINELDQKITSFSEEHNGILGAIKSIPEKQDLQLQQYKHLTSTYDAWKSQNKLTLPFFKKPSSQLIKDLNTVLEFLKIYGDSSIDENTKSSTIRTFMAEIHPKYEIHASELYSALNDLTDKKETLEGNLKTLKNESAEEKTKLTKLKNESEQTIQKLSGIEINLESLETERKWFTSRNETKLA